MYANALRSFEAQIQEYKAKTRGAVWERRVMGHGEACPECLSLARMGWKKFGTLPRIGATVCKTNCKCRFEYEYQNKTPR